MERMCKHCGRVYRGLACPCRKAAKRASRQAEGGRMPAEDEASSQFGNSTDGDFQIENFASCNHCAEDARAGAAAQRAG
jgi:hypothetical protein